MPRRGDRHKNRPGQLHLQGWYDPSDEDDQPVCQAYNHLHEKYPKVNMKTTLGYAILALSEQDMPGFLASLPTTDRSAAQRAAEQTQQLYEGIGELKKVIRAIQSIPFGSAMPAEQAASLREVSEQLDALQAGTADRYTPIVFEDDEEAQS